MSIIKMIPLILESRSTLTEDSTGSKIIDSILKKAEPLIKDMLAKAEEYQIKELKRSFTEYDKNYYRLMFTYELINSIEKYTLPTDKLINFKATQSAKGTVQINSTIERDGKQYPLSTDVIYAGGHNIQRLHFRYITKTSLPRQPLSPVAAAYKEKMKRMSKLEKLNTEVQNYQNRINKYKEKIANAEKILKNPRSEQIILDLVKQDRQSRGEWSEWPDWEEIVRRGAAKNFNNDPRAYEEREEKYLDGLYDSWIWSNVKNPKQTIVSLTKEMNKLQSKIDTLSKE